MSTTLTLKKRKFSVQGKIDVALFTILKVGRMIALMARF